MIQLKNKKILFVSVSFFNYEIAIVSKLEELGAIVDFYDDRPSNSLINKGIVRLNKKLISSKINHYYKKILKEINQENYDYFLLIKGEATPRFFVKELKARLPKLKTIYYTFDSFTEYPHLVSHLNDFDENFTFDRNDAHKYGLHFRPLFFLDEYYKKRKEIKSPEIDIAFVGSAHTDRYIIGENVRSIAEILQLKTFFYYYAMDEFVFKLKKIFDKNLQYFNIKKLSFKTLSHQQIIEIYQKTKSVLDINKPFQNGLTIRTFEVLALGKKLITTNADVINYPLYHPQNILIINRENIILEKFFFETEFKEIENEILQKMSLESFIECLFVKNQDEYWNNQ